MHIDLRVPTSWEHVTRQQLLVFGKYFWTKFDVETISKLFVEVASAGSFKQKRQVAKLVQHIRPSDFYGLLDQVNFFKWIYEDNVREQPILQHFYIGRTRYFGPGVELHDCAYYAWQLADTYFVKYLQDRHPQDLACFAAALYRPKKKGQRIPFTEQEAEARANLFLERVPQEILHAAALDYSGLRTYLITHPELSILFEHEGNNNPSAVQFTHADVILGLTKNQPTKYEETLRLPVFTVLRQLAYYERQRRLADSKKEFVPD